MSQRCFAAGILLALVGLGFNARSLAAQEGAIPVDHVIAQVNDDVITASTLKRETKERIAAMMQGGMEELQAAAEASRRQGQLIVDLINEMLLLQRGKELNMALDIEAEVNRQLLRIANNQGINSIEKLHAAIRDSGLNPEEVRRTMRSQMTKEAVLQREVDRKVYLEISATEIREYFATHPDKFREPESVDGRSPAGPTPSLNDEAVRRAILQERQAGTRAAYLKRLRNDAFIKIADPYRASVEPLL